MNNRFVVPADKVLDEDKVTQFLIAFTVLWILMCIAISLWGGWSQLTDRYRGTSSKAEAKWGFESASMRRMAAYPGCLKFSVGREGLGISILFLFRVGHPPLLIPWTDITAHELEAQVIKKVRLKFAKESNVPLTISLKLARRIRDASITYWNPGF